MTSFPCLGVCYFPEHWPDAYLPRDAERMVDNGIKRVRIGEFSWAKIEPKPGVFEWDWLDRAFEVLGSHDLEIVLCTPTATPPKWLVDAHPDILAIAEDGTLRKFGSRRHYSFSSETYRKECSRIVTVLAERYGKHPALAGWQTDNEYGCHDTTRSYCENARKGFQRWLKEKYRTIDTLNNAWGNIFWSQLYNGFDAVELPNMTVTEPNPSHVLDFYRFASDEVVDFNKLQTKILRQFSPAKDIYHNFMGFYFGFDHFKVCKDIDSATWDSYPLGFLDVAPYPEEEKHRYLHQGHPDFAAFHHDLYRGCGNGRWQVMEQQPGPVNWAHHNPAPLAGMVRLWSHEAIAHGAEVVSYFRWRQVPFAQEQMHAGLLRSDDSEAAGLKEAHQTANDLAMLNNNTKHTKASIAFVFSYEAKWLFDIHPQGASWNYIWLCMEWYSVIRRLGVDIDIVAPDHDLDGYKLVLAPSLPIIHEQALKRFKETSAQIILGPRSGSKTTSLQIPETLPPGPLQDLLPISVTHSESLPKKIIAKGRFNNKDISYSRWLDHMDTPLTPIAVSEDGHPLAVTNDRVTYLAACFNKEGLGMVFTQALKKAGVALTSVPADLRLRRRGNMTYAFNYGTRTISLKNIAPDGAAYILGQEDLNPADVACWQSKEQ